MSNYYLVSEDEIKALGRTAFNLGHFKSDPDYGLANAYIKAKEKCLSRPVSLIPAQTGAHNKWIEIEGKEV